MSGQYTSELLGAVIQNHPTYSTARISNLGICGGGAGGGRVLRTAA